jgi:hypothetical protein
MTVVDSPLLPKTIRSTLAAPHRVRRQGLSLRTQRWRHRRLCAGSLGTATVVKGFPASDPAILPSAKDCGRSNLTAGRPCGAVLCFPL